MQFCVAAELPFLSALATADLTALLVVLQAQLMDVDGDVEHKRARDSITNGLGCSSEDHGQQDQVRYTATAVARGVPDQGPQLRPLNKWWYGVVA